MTRRMFCMAKTESDYPLFRGVWNKSKNHSHGKALPAGCIQNAVPYVTDAELTVLAKMLHRGAGKIYVRGMIS